METDGLCAIHLVWAGLDCCPAYPLRTVFPLAGGNNLQRTKKIFFKGYCEYAESGPPG
jgi:hypothetical protein